MPFKFPTWSIGDNVLRDPKDVSNCIGEHFAKASSDANYTPAFQVYKEIEEAQGLNVVKGIKEDYNDVMSLEELKNALKDLKEKSPGCDGITALDL